MLKLATKLHPDRANLELAYQAGFRNTELFLTESDLINWQATLKICQEYPFKYVPHFVNKAVSLEAVAGILHLYTELNCQAMVIHEPMFLKYAEEIRKINSEVMLGIENHFQNPEQMIDFASKAPFLTLDIEHLWILTWPKISQSELIVKFKEFWSQFGSKVIHIHFPGPRADEPYQHRPMYNNRELVFAIFDYLDEQGYEGFIVSEVDQYYQNYQDLHMDVLLFDRWRNRDRTLKAPTCK